MFRGYEKTVNYQLSPELLTAAMNEAVDRYLALHQNVFPTGRQDTSVELKVQRSYVSEGEKIVVSVRDESFYVASKFIKSSPHSSMVWVKNWRNVTVLNTYMQEAVQELSSSAA